MHGYGFVSDSQAKNIFSKLIYNEIRINVADNSKINSTTESINQIYENDIFRTYKRDEQKSVSLTNDEISQTKKMAIKLIFPIQALL